MSGVTRIFSSAASVAGILLLTATSLQAGGFAIREQSASGLGSAFAGIAAGGDLSSLFWNPAALAEMSGTNLESHAALILGDTEHTISEATNTNFPIAGGNLLVAFSNKSGNIADPAVVPATYAGTQVNSRLSIGIGLTSPIGLVTEPENSTYAGAEIARTAKVFTINVNPVISYKLTDKIAVGFGPQIQYMDATLKFATGLPSNPSTFFTGDTDKVEGGFTAGILLTPLPGTAIGVGYRSAIDHELRGKFQTQPGVVTPAGPTPVAFTTPAKADLKSPELVTVSLRQDINPKTRALATFEWASWSDFSTLKVISTGPGSVLTGAGPVAIPVAGVTLATLNPDWNDSWFVSFGLEYDWDSQLTVRGGLAYEESPIQSPEQRLFSVPDSNRIWLNVGATYRWSERTTFDVAYSHIFFEDATARATSVPGTTTVVSDVDNSANIIAVSFKRKLGGGSRSPLK